MSVAARIAEQPSVTANKSQGARGERDPAVQKSVFWRLVLAAADDVDQLARRAVTQLPTQSRAALVTLHDDLRDRLSRLRSELSGVADYELIMLVLVFHFDERVMWQLPDTARLQWVPLQREWIGSSHGGHEFFRILDKVRANEKTASLIFEVFYYCLHNGFVGRYDAAPETIDAYKRELISRIDRPAVSSQGTGESSSEGYGPLPNYWHPAVYYILTFVAIVVLIAVITLMTNC